LAGSFFSWNAIITMKSFSHTSTNRPPHQSRFRRLAIRFFALGLILVVLIFTLPKVYSWTKRLQSERLSKLALDYAAHDGKLQEAMAAADTAIRLNPNQSDALRFMAGMLEVDGRSSQAMELYGRRLCKRTRHLG
jgi:tetratricopeptide (TPR) repeat protein